MLQINIPYTGYSAQENTALSAGRLWNQSRVSGACSGPAMAPFEHWLYVILLAAVPVSVCGDYGEQMFSLSCLRTHKSWQRLGPRLHTHTAYPHASAFLSALAPVHCCFTLKEITDVSKNSVFTTAASLLPSKNHRLCGEVSLDWKRHEVREELAYIWKD